MQRLFITALACLISVSVVGQNLGNRLKVFYDSDWNITEDQSNAEYYRIYGDYNPKDQCWALKAYFISGEIQWEGNVKNPSPTATVCSKALCNGEAIFYRKNGQIKSVYNYKDGDLDGIQILYCKSGAINVMSNYKKGKLVEESIEIFECEDNSNKKSK